MKKNIFIFPLVAIATSCAEKSPQQPNIVLILADDIGIGDLECYGYGLVPTPHINTIANNGVRFTNAHSTSATSTPSRFGILTGAYPWRFEGTGIAAGDAGMIITPERFTIADLAKSAGYTTAAIGKWHLGIGQTARQNWNGKITPNLSDIGFDYSYIMAATGDRVPCVFIENGAVENWDKTTPIEVSYDTPFEGEPTGKNNPELLRLHPSHGHNQAIVGGVPRIGYMKGGGKALWRDEDIVDKITHKATSFIKENAKKNFFLYFGTNDIHVPRLPHERFLGKTGLGTRGDALLSFDYSVGEIMKALEEAGVADNTIVIITSDNGPVIDDGYQDRAVELLGEHKPMGKYRGGKYSAFEAGTRVPYIVYWKGKTKKGKVSNALVSQIDVMATIAEILKKSIETEVDSRSALTVMLGESDKGREYVIEQNAHNTLSVLKDNWKYIPSSGAMSYNSLTNIELGNTPEDKLYNILEDAGEQNNCASINPNIIVSLKTIIDKEIAKGAVLKEVVGNVSHQ